MELKEKTDFFNAIKQLIEKELDFHFSFKETEDKDLKDDFNSFLINSTEKIVDKYCNVSLRERLAILFEYEKHYLEMVKEYKEEIKFAASLQEDIRKERSKFFSETLKEVSGTLKETGIESSVINHWIIELVASYTKSLDLSSELAKEQVFETIGALKQDGKTAASSCINNSNKLID